MDQKLTWHNHIDKVCNKLSSSIYVLRNLSNKVSRSVSKCLTAFHALIQTKISYAILAWFHASVSSRVFALQRKAVRILSGLNYRDPCIDSYIQIKIFTVPSTYISQCLIHVKQNLSNYVSNTEIHDYEIRNRINIYVDFHRLSKSKTGINYYGPKMFNLLPATMKTLSLTEFKKVIKNYLLAKCFYSIDDYFNNNFYDTSI